MKTSHAVKPANIRVINRRRIDRIGTLLRLDPRVFVASARIRFVGIGSYALHTDVFAYVKERDYAQYLAIAEEFNFAIMKIVKDVGARLALPLQDLYLDPGWNSSGGVTGEGGLTVNEAR
jgi:hypothetical protein